MKIRIASTLLALMLPLAAQEPAANHEAIFYKAFYLEKGARDIASAMVLYQQFLDLAPEHKLAKEAAQQQYGLLHSTGKTKEREAFKTKYEKLLGNVAPAATSGDRPEGGGADAPRGRGEGQGRPGAGGGGDMQARMAELEKQLAKAKEEGNAEEVKKLEDQIARMKQMAERRGAGGGNAGAGGGRGGLFAVLGNNKKISEMTAEEKKALKDAVSNYTVSDRMRERVGEDVAKKLEENVASLKKALDADKTEDAQKALDAVRAAMPARRGGGGGDAGGGRGGNGGGGGGGNGGGGGGNGGGIR